jgi:hypothetical protein
MNRDVFDVDGATALPRRNGELAFDAPWQSRVFGLCAAIVETCFDGDREPFRQRLIEAISADPDRPYWDSWTIALEQLVLDAGLVDELPSTGRSWPVVPRTAVPNSGRSMARELRSRDQPV